MTSTTFDDIFQCFIDNTGSDVSRLPKDNEGKYAMIHNAIRHYNTVIGDYETKITYDDLTETINIALDDNKLLLLAYCMKYVYLENQLVEFEEVWQPFQKELGQKFYREQIQGRENTLARTQTKIDELLSNITNYDYN